MSSQGDQKPPSSGDPNKSPDVKFDQTMPEEAINPALPKGAETLPEGALNKPQSAEASKKPQRVEDTEKTLPEGAFDKTLPEGAFDEAVDQEESDTMVGEEPSESDAGATMIGEEPSAPEDGATMVSDESHAPDEGATMIGEDEAASSVEDDFGKTLPEGALAEGDAGSDFAEKTMMMDDVAEEANAPSDDYGKTLADDGPNESGEVSDESADTDKTMVVDESVSGGDEGDEFGKTIQVDSYAVTMTDDSGILPQEDFLGKTMVGADSAVEQELPPRQRADKTMATPSIPQGGDVVKSRATRTGGLTSVAGTEVGAAHTVDGIEKESLNVAQRSISGLQYGIIPRVDFKLVKQLGEGGMGVVYVAKQASLGRDVVFKTLKPMPDAQASKLKQSGTYQSVIKHRTDMFLSEAVVTADLFHPNIVPIYELAEAPDGSLFYTMKWVRGVGWNKRIKEMTLEENLEALMKVADAIAFAHSRHVVNRDLKPENVMLGEYGETIVLDWGLALPFGEGKGRLPLATTAGLGSGTPAYMPPELITGPLNKIGPACDIYLLGAMLFEVITGQPPHDFVATQSKTQSAGAKMAEIRRVVVDNVIRETEHSGELMDIARKAMGTKPEERYRSVVEFQQAIRDYQKHAASRTLVERAKELTAVAAPTSAPTIEVKPTDQSTIGYANYQNALALYNESLREWPGNHDARDGLTETQLHFAKLALSKGDYDLGLSVLDTNAESHTDTRAKLVKAREDRDARVRGMKLLKIAASVLIGAVFLLLAVAARFQFNLQAAQKALITANEAKTEAEKDKAAAEVAMREAEIATEKAKQDLVAANVAKREADLAKMKAEQDLVVAKMATDKAEEATKKAEANLVAANELKKKAEAATKKAEDDLKVASVAKKQAEEATKKAEENLIAANRAAKKAEEEKEKASYLAGLAVANRFVQEGRYPDARKKLQELKKNYSDRCKAEWDQLWNTVNAPQAVSLSKPVESISISRDGRKLVAGDKAGDIVVWSIDDAGKLAEEPLRRWQLGSRARAVAMSPDGDTVAAAGDNGRILVWSFEADRPPAILKGHEGAVNTLKFSSDGKRLASGSDDRTLKVWLVSDAHELLSEKVMYAVQCVDWSRDGKVIVAGTSAPADVSGVAYSWELKSSGNDLDLIPLRTFQVPPEGRVKQDRGVVAIALTDDGQFAVSNGPAAELHLWRVDLRSVVLPKKAVKVNVESEKLGAHSSRVERVRSLTFSSDGSRLLAAGDDGTISIWNRRDGATLPAYERAVVLYGHGGPVRGCLFLPQSPDLVVSGSYDQNVNVWNVKTYLKSRDWLDHQDEAETQPAAIIPSERDVSVLDGPVPCGQDDLLLAPVEQPRVRLQTFTQGEVMRPRPLRSPFILTNFQKPEKKTTGKPDPAAEENGRKPTSVQIVTGHTDSVLSAVFSRDGKRVLSASRDQTARAWNSVDGKPVGSSTGQPVVFDDNVFAEGHEYDLFAMRFFPDGQRLLTSGFDGTMRIWDARIDMENSFGRELATLPETGMYGVVEISRDGEWILTAGRKNSSQLWNTQKVLNSRQPQPDLTLDGQHRFRVTTVAISPDGSRLLSGDREGYIVFWDAKTGRVIGRQRNSHNGEVVKAEFLHDGTQLLTAGVDRRVVLWNVVESDSGIALQRVRQFDHEGMVVNLAVSSLGDRFISVARRGQRKSKKVSEGESKTKISSWMIESGKEQVIDLNSHSAATSISDSARTPVAAWAANGTLAAITATDGVIHFFDSNANRMTRSLQVDNSDGGARRALPFATILRPDEETPLHVITQTHNAAYLWRLKDGASLVSFRPQGPVFSAGYSSDGRFVVTGGRSVRIFNAAENQTTYGRPLHKIEYPHLGIVTSVEFTPTPGSHRFLTTSYDETAKIWEWLPDQKNVRLIHELKGHQGPVRSGTWSADGSHVLTVGNDAHPRIWSFPQAGVPSVEVLELPKAVAEEKPGVVEQEKNTNRDFDQLCGTFSWDGQFIAVGGRDIATGESIGWVWNLRPGENQKPALHATIRGHGLGGINSVAFLPDDDRLMTAGADGTARMWDWQKDAAPLTSGTVLAADFLISLIRPGESTTHRGAVTSVRVTPAGTIVTASSDGTVLIWPK